MPLPLLFELALLLLEFRRSVFGFLLHAKSLELICSYSFDELFNLLDGIALACNSFLDYFSSQARDGHALVKHQLAIDGILSHLRFQKLT